MSTPKSVIELAKKSGAKMVDIKFVDTFGTWQHFSCPIRELTEEIFAEGLGFDGSSIRGWKSIEASDMLAMPDPATAFIDPFCAVPTLSLTCTIAETGTREPYSRDPRSIAQKAEKYLASTGLADSAVFGPEAEFFIFDNVQFDSKSHGTFYSIDSEEAVWNTGREEMPNLGYKIRHKEGYFPVAPADTQQDIRTEMCLVMEELGVHIERQHHEVATAGQAEIDYRFDTLVKSADAMMVYKYVVKNVSRKHGKTACFMPKPLFGDNGSGMHTHQSLFSGGKNAFYDAEGDHHLSEAAKSYIAGLLRHAREIAALFAPNVNSYKRLVPGYEAPVYCAWSQRNRSALVRVPMYHPGKEQATRCELRCPDPSCNPYLTFAAMLHAGLDGIEHGYECPEPMERNLYELSHDERIERGIEQLPETLGEAIDVFAESDLMRRALGDHIFDRYVELKRSEWEEYRVQVTRWELEKYLPVL